MVNPIDLPPMPDSITGEPRPPRAPRIYHGTEYTPLDRNPRNPPDAPEHLGPTLEWLQPTLRDQYGDAAMLAGLLAVFGTISAGGFSWVLEWWAWGLLALFPWIMFRASGNHWTAAGVSWMQWRGSWVDTYKLTRIQFSADGYSRVLRLKDAHGNEIHSFKISEIQRNPDLWDLVYNGILHSVASGHCDIDAKTRRILKIPYELGPRPTRSERIRGRGRRG
ncbi:hypothetical protein [Rhodococcus pyridinivorans]|uniref:hypothetical protein n=1 Tax=Rhodococcus pyridinivorans TaxID=103816 RepID=UPI00110E12A1|nr:hypothetical protein [Rhodococcus pyridinivorans]